MPFCHIALYLFPLGYFKMCKRSSNPWFGQPKYIIGYLHHNRVLNLAIDDQVTMQF